MDLFILKTDVETFTSTNKQTLHLIFKEVSFETMTEDNSNEQQTNLPASPIHALYITVLLSL